MCVGTEVLALPMLDQVVDGDVNISQSISSELSSLQINQQTDKAILNWNSFNIAAQEGVHFQQPLNGVCLNRIDAVNGMSQIQGALSATGKIYLINQAGILFSESAKINVGTIIASTADITDKNFIDNRMTFDQPSTLGGSIINRGVITVAESGLAALLGSSVVHEGVIHAKLSNITLASGSKFTLDFYGDQLINFAVDAPTTSAGVDENGNALPNAVKVSGEIYNEAGGVLITGKAAQDVFDNLINMDGIVRAKSVSEGNGIINLLGDDVGIIAVNGELDVSGDVEGSEGGIVVVSGAHVAVNDEAVINASGQENGGLIYLGDFSEGTYLRAPYSKSVTVAPGAILNADAVQTGDGGEILVWSHLDTQFRGTATARGGALRGDGGYVEISSRGDWIFDDKTAKVDTSAKNGTDGTLEFDPMFLIVKTSGGSGYLNSINNLFTNNAAGTTTLTPSSIVTAAQLNNIKLQANSDVIFVDALAIPYNGKTLTVNAGRSVLINNNISTANGAIIFTANDSAATSADRATTSSGNPSGDPETTAGNITMASGTSVSSGTAALSMTVGTSTTSPYTPGSITVDSLTGGVITLTTPNAVTGTNNIAASSSLTVDVGTSSSISGVVSGAGSFTKKSAGTLTVNSANTYTGSTTISGGTLQAGVANAISSSSALILSNSSAVTFDLNNTNQSINTLSGGGAGGSITLGSATLTITQGDTKTFGGVISGSGGVTKGGNSALTFSGANTYAGATTVNLGTLTAGANNVISSSSALTLANTAGATFNLNNFNQSIGTLSGGGTSGGNITLGSATLTVNQGSNNTYAGVINGTGGLTVNGTATLTLTGSNTYTGATTISAGTLQAGAANIISSSVTLANTSGAVFDLNGYNQSIQTLSGGGTTGGNISLGSATLTINQGSANSFSGVIGGSGGITKNGSSTLTLGGFNTYTGTTAINVGTLQAGSASVISSSSAVTLANTAGAAFDLNGNNQSIGSLSGGGATGGNITLGSATLTVNQSGSNSYSGIISGTGNVTKAGSGTLTLNGANTYTGTTTINAGTLKAGAANVISSSTPVTLANVASAAFDLNNFNQSIGSLSGGGATGGNIALGSATLTINQTSANSYAGIISGSGAVTKAGSSTITLSGANTYTGTTTVNAGSLQAGAANVISSSNAVTLANVASATLDLNSFDQSIGTLSGAGSTGGNITLGSGTLTVNQATANTYAGVISGSGAVTINGTATLTLSGANTYTGVTTINNGTLQAGAAHVLPASSPLTLANTAGANLDLNGFDQSIGGLWGGGATGGNISLGSGVLTVTQNAFGTFSGVISGTGNLALASSSTNTLVLAGANTFSGTTTVNGGTIKVTSDNNLGTAPGTATANNVTINGGSVEVGGTFTLNSNRGVSLGTAGGTIQVDPTYTLTYAGVVAGSGALTKSGTGTLLLNGVNTYSGATNVTAGTLQTGVANAIANTSALVMSNTSTATFNLNGFDQTVGTLSGGGATGGNIILGGATLTVTQGSANTYAGVISGTGALTTNGTSRLTLSGINTYTGATSINSGMLQAGAANVIANSSSVTLANATGATFDLNNFNQSVGTLAGGGVTGGNITLGSATLNVNQGSANNYSGIISGTGGLAKNGNSTLTLAGVNTYSGATTINAGTLQAGVANTVYNSNNVVIANAASAVFDLNNFDQTVNNLSGGGATGGNVTLGTATLAVNKTSNNNFAGIISGSGDVILSGSARLNLSGVNTYTGTTTVNAGTLQAGVADVIANSDTVVLANTMGAVFDLNNHDQAIGNLSGGGSTGGNITLGTATLTVAQTTNDNYAGIISGAGGVTLAGTAVLNLSGANTYTGATNVVSGTLQAGAVDIISHSSPMTLADDASAIFDLNDFNQSIGSLSGGGTSGGNIALGDAVLLVTQTSPGSYDGLISGTGDVVLSTSSTSTLTLTGSNTYTGSTSVRAGTLNISDDSNLGTAPGTATANKLNLNGGTLEASAAFTLDANRGVTLGSSNGTIQVDPTFALTYNGVVAGSGALTKTGTGALTLGGANTYSGATTITAGTLQTAATDVIASSSALTINNAASAVFDLNDFDQTVGTLTGGGVAGGNITLGSGTLTVDQESAGVYAGIISGSGGLTKDNDATLTLTGANTYTGTTTVNDGLLRAGDTNVVASTSPLVLANVTGAAFDLNDFDQAISTLSGGGTNGGNITLGSATLTVDQGANTNYYGIISGSGGVTKNGTSMLTLNGANTYTGATTVNAGSLQAGAANVISAASALDLADVSSAVFDLNSFDQTVGTLSGGGTTGGNVTLGYATLTVNQVADDTYSGVISDFAGGGLILNGGSTLTLAGANTYSGATTVNSGMLQAGATDVIANSSQLVLANEAGAAFDLNDFDQHIGTLSGGGGSGGNVTLGSATLIINQSSDDIYYGIVSGTGSVIKTGTNLLSLGNVNAYTGTTTIDEGTLQAAAVNTISTSTPINISLGALFDLNGYDQSVDTMTGDNSNGANVTLGSAVLNVTHASGLVIQQ